MKVTSGKTGLFALCYTIDGMRIDVFVVITG